MGFDAALDDAVASVGGDNLAAFRAALRVLEPEAREELYTGTFEVTPRCVPYVSIHLFGEENFKRGEFMAALHHRHASLDLDPGVELPDHLAVMLRYAAALQEPQRRELVEYCLLGPLAKMINLLSHNEPYRHLLECVDEVLRAAYPGLQPALSPLEQMRLHGNACPTASGGCSCGPTAEETTADPLVTPAPTA
jgi:nitrate reductase molybdenum cofactor assembly chaperone